MYTSPYGSNLTERQRMIDWGVSQSAKSNVFRFHAPILSFGEAGSLGSIVGIGALKFDDRNPQFPATNVMGIGSRSCLFDACNICHEKKDGIPYFPLNP